jgi:hypothetical protein
MSKGKYSPTMYKLDTSKTVYDKNCFGKKATKWSKDLAEKGVQFDEKTMFENYDSEGFDSYGYSAFSSDGEYLGIGSGVDRLGHTEFEYLCMSDEEFEKF